MKVRRSVTNRSGYVGVSYHKGNRKWCARIKIDGRSRTIGYYDSAELAAIAYTLADNARPRQRYVDPFGRTA